MLNVELFDYEFYRLFNIPLTLSRNDRIKWETCVIWIDIRRKAALLALLILEYFQWK